MENNVLRAINVDFPNHQGIELPGNVLDIKRYGNNLIVALGTSGVAITGTGLNR